MVIEFSFLPSGYLDLFFIALESFYVIIKTNKAYARAKGEKIETIKFLNLLSASDVLIH